ncbi:hypothetical protein EV363DRAFT_1445619 [Boletus edulis]|nr:hypothetical protein EV363DRAFT_1445619 [Boletus edulis]
MNGGQIPSGQPPHIRDMILEGSKNGYRKLRLLKLLRPEPVSRDDKKHDNSPPRPEQGWEGSYVGDAVKAPLHRVQWQPNMGPQRLSRLFHTNYCGIVRYSGMG